MLSCLGFASSPDGPRRLGYAQTHSLGSDNPDVFLLIGSRRTLSAIEDWRGEARLSELVKRAQQQPQQLTSRGEPVAVVVSAEDYHRHRHEGESLVAFIRRSPLVGVDDLNLERSTDFTRDMEL